MSTFLQEYSEKYNAALNTETALRNLAFLSDYEAIGTILVQSLTPRLYLILTTMKSPLLVGGDITPESLLTFLWIIKVKKEKETQSEFFESFILSNDLDLIIGEIVEYLRSASRDMVASGNETDIGKYLSSFASLIMTFACECGWTEQDILDIPYKRLHQYIRFLQLRSDPTSRAAMSNATDLVLVEMTNKK